MFFALDKRESCPWIRHNPLTRLPIGDTHRLSYLIFQTFIISLSLARLISNFRHSIFLFFFLHTNDLITKRRKNPFNFTNRDSIMSATFCTGCATILNLYRVKLKVADRKSWKVIFLNLSPRVCYFVTICYIYITMHFHTYEYSNYDNTSHENNHEVRRAERPITVLNWR